MKTKLIVIGLVALMGATVVGAAAAHRFVTHKGTRGADVLNGSDAAERFLARGGNDLVNALGGSCEDVEVDVDQLELGNGDRILLCSDGLTDMVDDDAILRVLAERHESKQACRQLLDLALHHGGKDNVTIVVATYTF